MNNEKFKKYLEVQKSGVTNMFDIEAVMSLSGLSKSDCLDIMKHYDKYFEIHRKIENGTYNYLTNEVEE